MVYKFIRFFSEERFADDFISGKLYFNTLKYFRDIEQTDGRGDPYEGILNLFRPQDISVNLKVPDLSIDVTMNEKDFFGPITVSNDYNNNINILCLYAISPSLFNNYYGRYPIFFEDKNIIEDFFKIDNRCKKFGKWAVFISKPDIFIDKLKKSLEFNNKQFKYKLVEYYDEKSSSFSFPFIESAFQKQKQFDYQREFRVCVYPDNFTEHIGSPMKLQIGDLSPFAFKIKTEQLIDGLSIKVIKK